MEPRAHRVVVALIALALCTATGAGQAKPPEMYSESAAAIETGGAALAEGAYEQARFDFERALEAARQRKDRAEEADLLFYLGLTEQQWAGSLAPRDPGRIRLLEESAGFYTGALSAKAELQQKLAPTLNNLGRVYLDLGRYDAARDLLKQALDEAEDDPRRPLYAKSYACALAKVGRWQEGATWYRTVLENWPEDTEAHEALVDLYLEHASEALPEYLWWLAERGQVNRAQAGALKVLQKRDFSEEVGASLLAVVVGALARQYGAPGQFQEGVVWKALAPLEADKRLGPGVRELARLYKARHFQPESFRWWRMHGMPPPGNGLAPRQAFRRLAVAIGRWYGNSARPVSPTLAERYFDLAKNFWEPEPDPVAIFELADLYIQANRIEDLDRLSDASPGFLEAQEQDWQAIFDFHRALGLVYSTLGRWGDSSTPASAIFQLEHARLVAEEHNRQLADSEPFTVSPQVLGLLALGYEEIGRAEDARSARAEAAAAYRLLGDEDAARLVLGNAVETENAVYKLGFVLDTDKRGELDRAVLGIVTDAFLSSRRFSILERSQLDAAFTEKSLQEFLGQGNESLSEILGLDLLGVVKYTFEPRHYGTSREALVIKVRLVDTRTGKLLVSMTSESPSYSVDPFMAFRRAESDLSQSVREAFPPFGYVVDVTGRDVVVDLGIEAGLKDGDVLEVLQEGKPIIHPITGEALPAEMTVVGELEVTSASPQVSSCRLNASDGAAPIGSRVRLKKRGSRGYITVAVVGFTNLSGFQDLEFTAHDLTTSFLHNLPGVGLVTRDRLDLLRELSFPETVKPETVSRIGQLVNADALITGTILRYDIERRDFKGYGTNTLTYSFDMTVNFRVLDVATGRVRLSKNFDAKRSEFYPDPASAPHQPSDLSSELFAAIIGDAQNDFHNALTQMVAGLGAAGQFLKVPVTTKPAGASVLLNGIYVGDTPYTLQLTSGEVHEISLELPGYETWRHRVKIEPGMSLDVNLVPKKQ